MASGRLIVPLGEPILNNSGVIAPGSTWTTYLTGTNTLASMFSNEALSTPIANPQVADQAGRFEAQSTVFWLDASQAYDVVIHLPTGQQITFPNLYTLGAQTNVSGFAPLNSPHFTGVPTAPTTALNDNSGSLATTAYVQGQNFAPLASPGFSGVPTAPTAAPGTNTTQLATTAFVTAAAAGSGTAGLTTNGHFTLPGGLVLQWGQDNTSITGANQNVTVTLPTAFPTACFGAAATINNSGSANSIANVMTLVTFTTTSLTFRSNGYQSGGYVAVPGFFWFAWGH